MRSVFQPPVLPLIYWSQKEHHAAPSFTTYLLEHQAEYELSDDELAYLAGSMFGAGSDSVYYLHTVQLHSTHNVSVG